MEDTKYPILELIYWHYGERHYMSNGRIKKVSQLLEKRLESLLPSEGDQLFDLVGTLCAEHEKIAFQAGLRLGAQLMLEIIEDRG